VARLLEQDGESEGAIPDVADAFLAEVGSLEMPAQIGRYRIVRRLGVGGMGAVFEAEQDQPRRRVALKVIRSGVGVRQVLQRFAHETGMLGRLRHPGIAQIYEAGTWDSADGAQPYFAMELVDGPTLSTFVKSRRPEVRAVVSLLARICDAVEHAHQKGIIHRDLKPGNILIDESHDPVLPKILDFGVARALDSDIQATTLTNVGQIMGTIAYMSPEQVGADPAGLDTRSDVYALGVIGYEMLCGQLPYELGSKSVAECLRVIAERDPVALGTVDRTLRGDLETIVGKALEKDKARRYQSAVALAADLRRWLRDDPISAHPPSTMYQIRKFARRNRALVCGVCAAFVLLVAAVVGTSIGFVRANRQTAVATAKARQSEKMNDYLRGVIEWFDPNVAKGPTVTMKDLLDAASQRVGRELGDEPIIEAAVLNTIGNGYVTLTELDAAEQCLVRSLELRQSNLGRGDPAISESLTSVGMLRHRQGRYEEAEGFLKEAVANLERAGQSESRAIALVEVKLGFVLKDLNKLEEAELRYAHSIKVLRAVPIQDTELANALSNYALVLRLAGRTEEAEPLSRESLDEFIRQNGELSIEVAYAANALALVLKELGKRDEAEPYYQQSLRIREALFGEDDPQVTTAMNNYAIFLTDSGRSEDAEPLYRRAVAIRRASFGTHDFTANSIEGLGILLKGIGKLDEALALCEESLAMRRELLGEEHPNVARSMHNLAACHHARGEFAEALELSEGALDMYRRLRGDEHPDVAVYLMQVSDALEGLGRLDEAEARLRESLDLARRVLSPKHLRIGQISVKLGRVLVARGDWVEAEPVLREGVANTQANYQPAHGTRIAASRALAGCLVGLERDDEALELLRDANAEVVGVRGEDDDVAVGIRSQMEVIVAEREAGSGGL
jgi:non-specific serine/threonine protein kinase/serine/threonine-protein kinase